MTVIAYLLYGDNETYERELLFSILSMLRLLEGQDADFRISVISDRPRPCIDQIPAPVLIEQIIFSQAEFDTWSRRGSYKHRIKPCALIKALDTYQAPVILIDTDTYFVGSPLELVQRVSPGDSVMHRFEYWIQDEPVWHSIAEKLGDGMEYDGIKLSRQSPMYNSGVLGIDYVNRPLLDQVLRLLDTLHDGSPVFNIEQFAAGVVLKQFTHLASSDDLVNHYWGYERAFIHLQIARLLTERSTSHLEKLLHHPSTFEVGYPKPAMVDRLIATVRGKLQRWQSNYKFAYLSYRTALFYARRDIDYANIWARIALQEAEQAVNSHPSNSDLSQLAPRLQRDFSQFSQESIEALDWLDWDTKNCWLRFWD